MKRTFITVALLAAVSSFAAADQHTTKDAKLQDMLAKKQCSEGKPALKEVTKTVPKMVAGRMVPTATKETIVVCVK